MAPKRSRDDDESRLSKKQKKGFSVGPANLPEGTYKRKVQKIKKNLIHKAKVKKSYAKIKQRELEQNTPTTAPNIAVEDGSQTSPAPEPTLELHPDRQALLDRSSPSPSPSAKETENRQNRTIDQRERRQRKPRHDPLSKEAAFAQKRKEEAEAWQKAREEAERQRQAKLGERERFRKAMAKARTPGRDGKRKLGRESIVLLEKIKRMTGEDKG